MQPAKKKTLTATTDDETTIDDETQRRCRKAIAEPKVRAINQKILTKAA